MKLLSVRSTRNLERCCIHIFVKVAPTCKITFKIQFSKKKKNKIKRSNLYIYIFSHKIRTAKESQWNKKIFIATIFGNDSSSYDLYIFLYEDYYHDRKSLATITLSFLRQPFCRFHTLRHVLRLDQLQDDLDAPLTLTNWGGEEIPYLYCYNDDGGLFFTF